MGDLQQQLGEAFQNVAVALINGIPDSWTGAELNIAVQTEGDNVTLKHAICTTEEPTKYTEPSDDLTAAVTEFFLLCARADQSWLSLSLKVEVDEQEDWSTEAEMGYPDEDRPLKIPANLDASNIRCTSTMPHRPFDPSVMSAGFRKLLVQHAAMGVEKQGELAELLIDNWDWQADLEHGKLTLGDKLHCKVRPLGAASESSNTWLWAWANKSSEFSDEMLSLAEQIKKLGKQHDIWEFTTPQIELERISKPYLAVVACGLAHADLAFWATDDGEAALLVGNCPAVRERLSPSTTRVIRVLKQTVSIMGDVVDHRKMAMNYLKQKGYKGKEEGHELRITSPEGDPLTITFDDEGRLSNVQAQASS
jgi:hypothetical protein